MWDGIIDVGERCDTNNLNGQTCSSIGPFVGGELKCNSKCQFDTSKCIREREPTPRPEPKKEVDEGLTPGEKADALRYTAQAEAYYQEKYGERINPNQEVQEQLEEQEAMREYYEKQYYKPAPAAGENENCVGMACPN